MVISATRFPCLLKNLTALVLFLVDNNCVPAAKNVVKGIASAITENANVVKELKQPHVDAYFDAILALEAVSEESVLNQLVAPVFSVLEFYQQCCLLINLTKNSNSRIQASPSCLMTYEELCLMLLRRGLCSSTRIATIVADLVSCFIQLDSPEILKTFIKNVLWRKDSSGVEFNANVWMDELITKALTFTSVKDVLSYCIKEQMLLSCEENAELFRLFVVILRMERNPQMADSSRLSFLINSIPAMPAKKLLYLADALITKGSVRMKQHKSCQTLLLEIGRSILELNNLTKKDERHLTQGFFDVLKYFAALTSAQLGDANQIVHLFCQISEWSPYRKNEMIHTIFSSPEIWNGVPATYVSECLTTLMASWIAGLHAIVNLPCVVPAGLLEKIRYINSTTSDCVQCYIQEVKSGRTLDKDLLSPLLNRMSNESIAQVIVNVFEADVKQLPSLKKFPTALEFYTELCQSFLKKNEIWAFKYFKNNSSITSIIKTISCLLWLGDGECIGQLTNQLSAVYQDEPNCIFLEMIKSAEIQNLVDSYPQARDSFRQVLEHRVAVLLEKLKGEGLLQMSNASLPGHPIVEDFLKSCKQQMAYSNFRNKYEGHEFVALLLSLGTANGYFLQAEVTGQHFGTKCDIKKIENRRYIQFSEEKANLENMILSLQQRKRKSTNNLEVLFAAADDEVVVLAPPAKQQKRNLPVIDIS